MPFTKDNSKFYFQYNESAKIKLHEVFRESNVRGKIYYDLGAVVIRHWDEASRKFVACTGKECSFCGSQIQRVITYTVESEVDGQTCYIEMQKSLANLIIDNQRIMSGIGMTPEAIKDTVFFVQKLDKGAKPLYKVTPVKKNAAEVTRTAVAPVHQADTSPVAGSGSFKSLNSEDVAVVAKYKATIKKRVVDAKSNGSTYNYGEAIENSLKMLGWSVEKIEVAKTLFNNDGDWVGP